MAGLKARLFGLCAAFAAFGFWVNFSPVASYARKTEHDMELMAPAKVGIYSFQPSAENPLQSYKMDAETYRKLRPYGIVARTYVGGNRSYDVVLIASQERGSFHDPRVCFSSQGWSIANEAAGDVNTSARGKVPCTIVTLNGPQNGTLAMYFYRGPQGGFYRNVVGLKLGMFKERLTGGKDVDGVFYRFIPNFPGATADDLKQFADQYLASAKQSSGGYF